MHKNRGLHDTLRDRPEEAGITGGEHHAVGSDQPVPVAGQGTGDADNRCRRSGPEPRQRPSEPGVFVAEDPAANRPEPITFSSVPGMSGSKLPGARAGDPSAR